MSIQTFGLARFREAIARTIQYASDAAALVTKTANLELLGPPSLGVLCFRCRPAGAGWTPERIAKLNEAIQARVIGEGAAMISSTRLRGVYSLRLCIMSHRTTWDDVRGTIERIAAIGEALAPA
jgi:glutamate/tyrosine decarboxylase-like PLP-dependent enzyme